MLGVLSQQARRSAREADHSPLSTAEVRNVVFAAMLQIRHAPSSVSHMTSLQRAVHNLANRVGGGAFNRNGRPNCQTNGTGSAPRRPALLTLECRTIRALN